MSAWTRVKWAEAAQVVRLMEKAAPKRAPEPEGDPPSYFDALRAAGRPHDAAMFLAYALPRLEAVGWAARSVRDLFEGIERPPQDTAALRAALLFVGDPSEQRRRTAYEVSEKANKASPERLACLAAFFSGGSIAPADLQPIQPPPGATARFAAGAVMLATISCPDPIAAIQSRLDVGVVIAANGLG